MAVQVDEKAKACLLRTGDLDPGEAGSNEAQVAAGVAKEWVPAGRKRAGQHAVAGGGGEAKGNGSKAGPPTDGTD